MEIVILHLKILLLMSIVSASVIGIIWILSFVEDFITNRSTICDNCNTNIWNGMADCCPTCGHDNTTEQQNA